MSTELFNLLVTGDTGNSSGIPLEEASHYFVDLRKFAHGVVSLRAVAPEVFERIATKVAAAFEDGAGAAGGLGQVGPGTAAVADPSAVALQPQPDGAPEEIGAELAPHDPQEDEELQAYLAEEEAAMAAQAEAETEHYRAKAEAAETRARELEQQVSALGQQVQQAQAASEQAASDMQASLQSARITQDAALQTAQEAHAAAGEKAVMALGAMRETLRQKQLAAAIRQGVLELKDRVMGQLANDPTEALEAQLTSPPFPTGADGGLGADGAAGAPGGGPPGAEGGAAPAEGEAASSPPSSGEGEKKAPKKEEGGDKGEKKDPKKDDAATSITVKHGAPSAGAIGGGLLGAASGAWGAHKLSTPVVRDNLRARVRELEAKGNGAPDASFGAALALASARSASAASELANQHPAARTAIGALLGGISGSNIGKAVEAPLRRSAVNIEHSMKVASRS